MQLGRLLIVFVAAVAALLAVETVQPASPVAAASASVTCRRTPDGKAPAAQPMANYTGIAPTRIVDTRDGTGGHQGKIGAGCTLRVPLDNQIVPKRAGAVAFSLTAIGEQPGYLTAYPCAAGRPGTSNLNTRPDMFPTPNLVAVQPDANHAVCIFSLFEADVIVDLSGYWTADGPDRFQSIEPTRAFDSRQTRNGRRVRANQVVEVDLSDIVPDGTSSVVANLTVTDSANDGFIGAFPCSPNPPKASNLNYYRGESRAVAAIVGLSADRKLCLNAPVATHMIVDIAGYYSPKPEWGPSESFFPVTGNRLADTRDPSNTWSRPFRAGQVRRLAPVDGLTNARQATAALVNVVTTEATAPGYLTVFPCGSEVPTASNLNYTAGIEATNMVTVDLSDRGEVCVYAHRSVDVIVDLMGIFAAPDDTLTSEFNIDRPTWPEFDPANSDYVAYCGHDPSTSTVTAERLGGTSTRINGVPVDADSVDIPVRLNELTHVQLSRGDTTRDYYFRCIPNDFPELDIDRTETPPAGWYTTGLTSTKQHWTVILNEFGAPVWYKASPLGSIDFQRRDDGRLAYASNQNRFGTDPERGIYATNLSGTLVEVERTVPNPAEPGVALPVDHHDHAVLPDGGRAFLSYPLLPDQDLTVLNEKFEGRIFTADGEPAQYYEDDTIVDGVIQEVGPDGSFRWQWRASDHFFYDEIGFPSERNWAEAYRHLPRGGEVDPWHLNAMQRLDNGDYLVTARHLDSVFRVDRGTGKVLWSLDGSSVPADLPNKDGATRLTYIDDPQRGPLRPHHGRLDGDVLTVFDNRAGTDEPSRAVAYRIDETAGTATLLWQIDEPQGRAAAGLGSTQVLPDGGVLVDWGSAGQPMFQEYDADHNSLMSISQVGGGVAYRIYKYGPEAFTPQILRATAGGSLETVDNPAPTLLEY